MATTSAEYTYIASCKMGKFLADHLRIDALAGGDYSLTIYQTVLDKNVSL